jgi:dTDP-4-dehydrorhamnose 3,5-epimerase
MRTINTSLDGVLLLEPSVFEDNRGFFMESYHRGKYGGLIPRHTFVQDNLSHSVKDVLRGLHYQLHRPQAKLLQVIRGAVFDVAVDIRCGSPSFGKWVSCELSEENRRQLYVAEGFAHGFCVLSDVADVVYKCSAFYVPEDEHSVLWCDPDLGIQWPARDPVLSLKDSRSPRLRDIPLEHLPAFKETDAISDVGSIPLFLSLEQTREIRRII